MNLQAATHETLYSKGLYMKVWQFIGQFVRDQRGMETVEWGILAALIVTGVVTVVKTLGSQILNKFTALQLATS